MRVECLGYHKYEEPFYFESPKGKRARICPECKAKQQNATITTNRFKKANKTIRLEKPKWKS